ncbi:hypothetical protein [Blastococcus sp. CT_GayMR16]|uniref:hypothetical protein n=1 Tax=Blastococcus sp. CT_GayMR16 TaxID=2559607 RepID=UPI001073DFEE|nr:hypothetical protein [Blastococcus sp. CT_GayMR16]TFV91404.1 hypothetical protein E4P38_02110 [Blastococcus sp. CT_GayMR16]
MRPFATADDLAGTEPGQVAWLTADQLTAIGDDADRILLRATELIAEHTTTGWTLNTDGDPAVTEVREALRDATCAQVEQWLEVGEENDVAGYSRGAAMGVGGVNLSSLPSILAPRARRILRLSGLNSAVAY